jgi:hypothetical protein
MKVNHHTGILIVTHNSASFIESCLEAALSRSATVLVVDNASGDDTCRLVKRFPAAGLIANPENRGFAAAVNQGFQALDCPFVLLLNPDAVLQTSLEPLVQACMTPGVGAAAGPLFDAAGRPQAGFMVRRFPAALTLCLESMGINTLLPGNPVNRRYRCYDLDLSHPQPVEQPAGAFLMIRRDAWLTAGGFDESFFPLWFEDVDFLKRLDGAGLRPFWVPAVTARHHGAHSASLLTPARRLTYWYDSLLRYAARHFGFFGFRSVAACVLLGCVARMVTGSSAGCVRVLRLATRSLFRGRSVFRADAGGRAVFINSHDHVA